MREFGPESSTGGSGVIVSGGNRPDDCTQASKSALSTAATAAVKLTDGETFVYEGQSHRGHGAMVEGAPSGERKEGDSKAADAAAVVANAGGEAYPEAASTPPPHGLKESDPVEIKKDRTDDPLDWAPGTGPVSARFLRVKVR